MDKTEPASEANETHECEFYLDNESVVYGCECGDIEIGGKTYYPEDKVNLLKEEITRLKAELERERDAAQQLSEYKDAIKELLPLAQTLADILRWDEEYSGDGVGCKEAQEIIDRAKKLIEK
jgi:molecular chaperone GrpE (heat shock protein)